MWNYFRRKLDGIKRNFLNRSPKGKWIFVRNVAISILKLTGADALNPDFKIWWYSYFPGFCTFVAFISFGYTVWYYSDTYPLKGFLFLPMFAIVVPSTILYILIMIPKSRNEFRSFAFFVGAKVYPDYDDRCSPRYLQIIDKSAIKLATSTMKIVAIIVGSMIIYLLFPVFAYIQSRELHLPIPILVPFTDLETKNGIIMNLSNQSSIAVMLIVGNVGIEMITCMMKNSVWAMTVAICHTMNEISEMAENPESNLDSNIDPDEPSPSSGLNTDYRIDFFMRNFSMQVSDLCGFITGLSELYYWKFLFQPFMLAAGVSLALFFHLYGIWKCGLGIALLFYAQLYILCDIGNEVDSANKLLIFKMHQMPWYKLTLKNQKSYGFILTRLQDGAVLRIGPFAELSFATLTDMTKMIYSILMMLLRVLE